MSTKHDLEKEIAAGVALTTELDAVRASNMELTTRCELAEELKGALGKQLGDTESALTAAKEEIARIETEFSAVSKQTTQLTTMLSELSPIQGALARTQEELSAANAEVTSLKSEAIESQKLLSDGENDRAELKLQIAAAERLVATVSVEKLRLKSSLTDAQRDLSRALERQSAVQNEAIRAEAAESLHDATEGELTKANATSSRLREQLVEVETKLDSLNKRYAVAERLVSSVSLDKAKMKAETEAVRARYRAALACIAEVSKALGVEIRTASLPCPRGGTAGGPGIFGMELGGTSSGSGGAIVTSVVADGAAASAGVEEGDVLVSCNGGFCVGVAYDIVLQSVSTMGATGELVVHLVKPAALELFEGAISGV